MDYFYYRGQKCGHCKEIIPVFGLGHHKPEEEGEDQFTKCVINFYNYGNSREMDYLLQQSVNLFKERFEGDVKFDFICVMPTHNKGETNRNMEKFARMLSAEIMVPYAQIVHRNKTIKGQHELKSKDERLENVKGSFDITAGLKGKNILVLDNLIITGSNAQELFDALKEAGAKSVFFICFGLGSKGREADFDINPNFKGKASKIVSEWHWPKVPKEDRQKYAEKMD